MTATAASGPTTMPGATVPVTTTSVGTTSVGTTFSGMAGDVPVIVVPPAGGARADAPVVLAWHLMDPPRSEAAFAAALPLDGLDAWRVYFGLPMYGSRLPAGGLEEVMRLGYEDAVMNLQGPVSDQAVREAAPAFASVREQCGIGHGPVGVLGGSLGAAVAMLVIAEGVIEVTSAVLVSPLVRLEAAVEALGRRFAVTYPWSDASLSIAARLDLVSRINEFEAHGDPPTLLIVGKDDDESGFREPAQQFVEARKPGRAELVIIPNMGHELTGEPGLEPSPQNAASAEIDRRAVEWFRRTLITPGSAR